MNNILKVIIDNKKKEIAHQKQVISLEQLYRDIEDSQQIANPISLKKALITSRTGIIAEFKRKSPSKGWIQKNAVPHEVIPQYEKAGASALSILTDLQFFGGTLADIQCVRDTVQIPILRKDFIIDEYQIIQARRVGANTILLIAACLTQEICNQLAQLAHSLGLEVLLEIHHPSELDYLSCAPDMVGVNNRNLDTFVTDVKNSFVLIEEIKKLTGNAADSPVPVSESGIADPETILKLREIGYRGFLLGEAFMTDINPSAKLREFIQKIHINETAS